MMENMHEAFEDFSWALLTRDTKGALTILRANPDLVNDTNNGRSALREAVNCDNPEVISVLIEKGADVTYRFHGETPSTYAADLGRYKSLSFFIENRIGLYDRSEHWRYNGGTIAHILADKVRNRYGRGYLLEAMEFIKKLPLDIFNIPNAAGDLPAAIIAENREYESLLALQTMGVSLTQRHEQGRNAIEAAFPTLGRIDGIDIHFLNAVRDANPPLRNDMKELAIKIFKFAPENKALVKDLGPAVGQIRKVYPQMSELSAYIKAIKIAELNEVVQLSKIKMGNGAIFGIAKMQGHNEDDTVNVDTARRRLIDRGFSDDPNNRAEWLELLAREVVKIETGREDVTVKNPPRTFIETVKDGLKSAASVTKNVMRGNPRGR